MLAPLLRFCLADIHAVYGTANYSCGPAALAACLGKPLSAVRGSLGEFGIKGYLSRSMMRAALRLEGWEPRLDHCAEGNQGDRYPDHGLARVQFGGSWISGPNANKTWAIKQTRWIASKRVGEDQWIFDSAVGQWQLFSEWCFHGVPAAIARLTGARVADGSYWLIDSWEIGRYRGEPCQNSNTSSSRPGGTTTGKQSISRPAHR